MNKDIDFRFIFIPFFLYCLFHFAVGIYASADVPVDKKEEKTVLNECVLKCMQLHGNACSTLIDLEEVICEL